MWVHAEFRSREATAQLLQRDARYVEQFPEEAVRRAGAWVRVAGAPAVPLPTYVLHPDRESPPFVPRILVADAQRTFWDDGDRASVVRFMSAVVARFRHDVGDEDQAPAPGSAAEKSDETEAMRYYHQGLGFVGSLLWMFVAPADALALLAHANTHSRFVPGYWRHQPVAFAVDAAVFSELLLLRLPEVATHLRATSVLPETFAQKWFVGLCVHVLPYAALFDFLDGFFEHGYEFLLRFGLSLCRVLAPRLLAETEQHHLYALLRLDAKLFPDPDVAAAIVHGVAEETLDGYDVVSRRAVLYKTVIRPRLEHAAAAIAAAHAAAAEDDDDDDDNAACDLCDEQAAAMNCEDCNKFLCIGCHEGLRGGHKAKHQVTLFDDEESGEADADDACDRMAEMKV